MSRGPAKGNLYVSPDPKVDPVALMAAWLDKVHPPRGSKK